MEPIVITLFLVGDDEEEAAGNFPFDSHESARVYDNHGRRVP